MSITQDEPHTDIFTYSAEENTFFWEKLTEILKNSPAIQSFNHAFDISTASTMSRVLCYKLRI